MNFIELTKGTHDSNSAFFFDGIPFPLTPEQQQLLDNTNSRNLKVGIRPEFVQLSTSQHPDSLPCEVVHTEDLGTYKIISVKVGEQILKARLGEDQNTPQHHAYITFPHQWVKVYIDEYLADSQPKEADNE